MLRSVTSVRIDNLYAISLLMFSCRITFSYTSGKNFIKITSVGMGAAKSNETR